LNSGSVAKSPKSIATGSPNSFHDVENVYKIMQNYVKLCKIMQNNALCILNFLQLKIMQNVANILLGAMNVSKIGFVHGPLGFWQMLGPPPSNTN
jgi:hypothetical protein